MSPIEPLESRVLFDGTPPAAYVQRAPVRLADGTNGAYKLSLAFIDDGGIDKTFVTSTAVRNKVIQIKGPNGFQAYAKFWRTAAAGSITLYADYKLSPPGGSWTADDVGKYKVYVRGGKVADAGGTKMPLTLIGTFQVKKPV